MLFLVFGSSGAGKTATIETVRGRLRDLAVHDFDEIGVPPQADATWRQRSNEVWVRRALRYQADRRDMLLAAQTPPKELLAAPSASRIEVVCSCLLDCDDGTRAARVREQGAEWFDRTGASLDDYVAWAAWLRREARTPGRRCAVIDTSSKTVAAVGGELAAWIAAERSLTASGSGVERPRGG